MFEHGWFSKIHSHTLAKTNTHTYMYTLYCFFYLDHSDNSSSDVLMSSSCLVPSLVTPEAAATEEITSSTLSNHSDDSHNSSFDPLSPLVLSLAKSSVLQQVVESNKSVQFPVTPDPFLVHNIMSPPSLTDQIPQAKHSVSPSKIPKDLTHLQAPTDKKHSRRRHSNDPYALSPQGSGRLVRSLEYTDNTQRNETQGQKSPTAISPSLKHSRSMGDVFTPKLKSLSTPSTPATDVSFELPLENVVLQGRVSSLSMDDDGSDHQLESYYTPKPAVATINTKYSINSRSGKATDINDDLDDDDDDSQETDPLISKRHSSPLKPRRRKRPQHKITTPGHSYNSIEDSQPLLEDLDNEDTIRQKTNSSSWFSNFSVRSVIGYLIHLGSGIGNLLLYYISEIFHPRTEPTNTSNNHID